MPTAVWTGSLSFGLVNVPVRLIPATEPKDVRFHLYDRSGRRVRYERVVEGSEPPVAEPGERTAAPAGTELQEPVEAPRAPEPTPPDEEPARSGVSKSAERRVG